MTDRAPDRWQDAVENICQAADGPISKTVRKAAEELYETLMITVQDYLRENVEFNLASKLQGYADTANRLRAENEQLKRRADIAEQMAEALRGIIPFIPKSSASEGGPNARSANVAAADKVRAALSAWEASNGNRRTATDDEIVEMTSREAALGPEESGNGARQASTEGARK